jgi:predicted ATPase
VLKALSLKNFTVFAQAELEFSPGLNVIVGENGTGKSHLLKVPYCVIAASAEEGRKPNSVAPTKTALQSKLADKMTAVMRPEEIGRLARRKQGVVRAEIGCRFEDRKRDVAFHLTTKSKSEVGIDKAPKAWITKAPVFLPTRELLTIYPNFVAFYDNHYLDFEETWRDTCVLLGAPAVRGPKEKRVSELLKPLEGSLGGKVDLDKNGRFYLNIPGEGRMEMPLVAEGLRKLAMVARLITTGSLLDTGYLFWDEPEANLNPKLIREVASSILHLCRNEVQVFVASHSLFLIRELDILLRSGDFGNTPARFFGLHRGDDGVQVQQGETVDDIGNIDALQEELSQSDRYLEPESA